MSPALRTENPQAVERSVTAGLQIDPMRDTSLPYRLLTALGVAFLLLAAGWGEAHAHSSRSVASTANAGGPRHAEVAAASASALGHAAYLPADRSTSPMPLGHCPSGLSPACSPPPALVPAVSVSLPEPKDRPPTGAAVADLPCEPIADRREEYGSRKERSPLPPTRPRLRTQRFLI